MAESEKVKNEPLNRRRGKASKPTLKTTSILIPDVVLKILQGISDQEERTLSNYLRFILNNYVCELVKSPNTDLSHILSTFTEEEIQSLKSILNLSNYSTSDLIRQSMANTYEIPINNNKIEPTPSNKTEGTMSFAQTKPKLQNNNF